MFGSNPFPRTMSLVWFRLQVDLEKRSLLQRFQTIRLPCVYM